MHPRNSLDPEFHTINYQNLDNKDMGLGKKDKFNFKRDQWEELLVRIFYMMEIGDCAGKDYQRYHFWRRAENSF
jgi:hypothetical protein